MNRVAVAEITPEFYADILRINEDNVENAVAARPAGA